MRIENKLYAFLLFCCCCCCCFASALRHGKEHVLLYNKISLQIGKLNYIFRFDIKTKQNKKILKHSLSKFFLHIFIFCISQIKENEKCVTLVKADVIRYRHLKFTF